jgi:LysR family hydrogen peroxide-inducible transcriptional activator
MTLKELAYLVAVADHCHFGRAAQSCHVSQPTLSTQLKKLEQHLDVALVERTNKSVHLTAVGEQIVVRAREILANAESIVALAKMQSSELAGAFNLGLIPTLSPYVLPWIAPLLNKNFSKLNLIVHEDITNELIIKLKEHRLDAMLLALPIDDQSLESEAIFDEPFWFTCHRNHPLAANKTISQANLMREGLLLLNEGHCLRDQALEVCGTSPGNLKLKTDFRASSLETIRQMVQAGWGATLLPALAIENQQNSDMVFIPLARPAFRRVGLVWRTGFPKRDELLKLADVIRQNLPASVSISG